MASRLRMALVNFLDDIFEFVWEVLALMLKTAFTVIAVVSVWILLIAAFAGFYVLLNQFFPPFAAGLGALLVVWSIFEVLCRRERGRP